MRITTILFLLLTTTNMNFLLANDASPLERAPLHTIINVHLNMQIIGTENISAKVFYYDIVGLESDATAKYLTSGVTKDLHSLITDLKLDKDYVKIGIKLKWEETAMYFLFGRSELTNGRINLNKGKQ